MNQLGNFGLEGREIDKEKGGESARELASIPHSRGCTIQWMK